MARVLCLTLNPALDLTLRLPRVALGAVNRSEALLSHAAGKGLNVAQVLADLGHRPSVAGFLGADNVQPFEALFARRGFHDAFVRVPGETRSNLKLVEDDGRVTDLNGPGPWVDASAQAALLDRLERLAAGHALAVVAGSLPGGVEPAWLGELLRRLAGLGLRVALDSSGAALRAGLEAAPWLIKPNVEELGEALGSDMASLARQRDAAARLRGRGIRHVVVSQGADGARWFAEDGAWQARPPSVAVASTVGAGDSLLAGLLHGLLTGAPAAEALRLATAIAAQAVTRVGFGIADREQLERLRQGVDVSALGNAPRTDSPREDTP